MCTVVSDPSLRAPTTYKSHITWKETRDWGSNGSILFHLMECFIYLSADFQQYQDKRKATWKFLSNPVLFRFSKDLLQSTAHNSWSLSLRKHQLLELCIPSTYTFLLFHLKAKPFWPSKSYITKQTIYMLKWPSGAKVLTTAVWGHQIIQKQSF